VLDTNIDTNREREAHPPCNRYDPGEATVSRMTTLHMLPSALMTASAFTSLWISWLNTHPTGSLCTLRTHRRRYPRNTRSRAARYGVTRSGFHRLERANFAWRTIRRIFLHEMCFGADNLRKTWPISATRAPLSERQFLSLGRYALEVTMSFHSPLAQSANSLEKVIARETRFGAKNYAPHPVVLARGDGAHLFDTSGKRYIDMMSAYSAASFGHLHPRLVEAANRQLARLDVVSRAYYSDNLGSFCQELAVLTGLDACLPMNTGTEAVETAIKAARRYGYDQLSIPEGKAEIIVAAGNFHGRTTSIIGFSSESSYRRGFGPFAPGFVTVPWRNLSARCG
jgi:hypothetical protein